MEQLRSQDVREWREGRRRRAWALKQRGWKQRDSATALGVTQGAVSRWLSRARDGGAQARRRRVAPGAPPRLTAEPRARIPARLERGPAAEGCRGEGWTQARVAEGIRRTFGVSYHPDRVGRRRTALRRSPRKPAARATQRDEAAIARGRAARWPALKKGR